MFMPAAPACPAGSLSARAWSPYAAGVLIGLLQIPAFLLMGTALGTSSSYVTVGVSLAQQLDPAITGIDYAARHLAGAKNWWQVALLAGIAAGAWLSSRLSGTARRGIAPVWRQALPAASAGGRFAMAFAAGFLLLAGARIADGCTSGHGLSGIAQLAAGSFIAVTAMFAGGIATAMMFNRIR
ncbi:MAG: YeeE/YedE thiosulfate transporter family protein [Thalassobaculales bacterium]